MNNLVLHHYRVKFYVRNDIGVIARMTVALRKYSVNIQSFDVSLKEGTSDFSNITMDVESTKDEKQMAIVMKKMERLIPVITAEYERQRDDTVKETAQEAMRFDF